MCSSANCSAFSICWSYFPPVRSSANCSARCSTSSERFSPCSLSRNCSAFFPSSPKFIARPFPGHAGPMPAPVDLAAVLAGFSEAWAPRTVATLNDYDVRVVKTRGEFTRHTHADTDEFFLVLRGRLTIRTDDGDVDLGPGQVYVVP